MLPLWTVGQYEHFALFGGRGGAKSSCTAEAIIGHACQRKERVVCGRQFQASLRDSVKELFEQKIKAMNVSVLFESTDTEIRHVGNGSRFSFIGMDRNPDSAKSLEGATIFWGEESQNFTQRAVEVIIPTIRASGSRMYWTWNPRYADDPVDAMFRGPHPPEKSYVKRVSYRDNPWFHQTRMPSELRRMLRANPKRALHVWEGGYDENPDAAIFENWEIGRPASIPEKAIPRFGMDFGYSNDPHAIVKSYLLEDIGTIYIAQEAYGTKVPNRHVPELMDSITEIRDWPITGDSSRPEMIEYINSAGFSMHGARKGAGSVKNGITWLQGYRLLIDPECTNIADEIKRYRWKQDPQGRVLPLPAERQPDHGIDALRYGHENDATVAEADADGVAYL